MSREARTLYVMKHFKMSFVKKVPQLVVVLSLACVAFQSEATIYTLTDGADSVKINDASGSGRAYDWTIGGVNQLSQQWFYYRLGSGGPEYPIDSISAPTSSLDSNNRILTTTYANSTISVTVVFKLSDTANAGQSQFDQDITVNNLSGVAQTLHFFQYSDYDLGGNASDQSALFSLVGGKYRKVIQTDGSWKLEEMVTPTSSALTTFLVEASSGTLLTSLTDANTTTLPNDISEGPGDISYAFQFQWALAASGTGSTFQLSKLQGIVPEPSSLALISMGGFILGWMKRRRLV